MACLTLEQLASLALGLAADEDLRTHVAICPICHAKLAELNRLTASLSRVHAELDHSHAASRAQLLAELARAATPRRPMPLWRKFTSGLNKLTFGQRIAASGVGLSTAAALLLLLAIFANSASRLSAMERMLTAVREVTSYSFNEVNHTTLLAPDAKPQIIGHETYSACWRAPDEANIQWLGDFHAEVKTWHIPKAYGEASNSDVERLVLHLAETYPTGKRSLMVIYTEGYYFWGLPIPAGDLPVDNTIAKLRAVQQGQGKIVRELGTKRIDSREARGYVLSFDDAVPFRGDGPVEVWVDPQTDLPIELTYKGTAEESEGKYIDEYDLTDIRWNIDFPPDQFSTISPAGLIDTTPPSDEKDIAEITAALKLYAKLSGGHYPPIHTLDPGAKCDPTESADPQNIFDGQLVRDEMLKLAGFTGPPQPNWTQDPKYRQIEAATPGLDWLTRMLLNRFRAGFFGNEVGPQDKDKVLLWWAISENRKYRVFYGNLCSETLPESKFKQLVPTAVLP
jgi:hypothetical protein